jgi:hypothetical protein
MPGTCNNNLFAVILNVVKYFSIPSPRLGVRHGFHKHLLSLYSIMYRGLDRKAIKLGYHTFIPVSPVISAPIRKF